jgi:hypothetical protein
VPMRLALALALVPYVEESITQRFLKDDEKEREEKSRPLDANNSILSERDLF